MYESVYGLIGYDVDQNVYRMWSFSRSMPEPMLLSGNFLDGSLIMLSEPTTLGGEVQKMRYSITPLGEESYEILGEYWTLEGWSRYCFVRVNREVGSD